MESHIVIASCIWFCKQSQHWYGEAEVKAGERRQHRSRNARRRRLKEHIEPRHRPRRPGKVKAKTYRIPILHQALVVPAQAHEEQYRRHVLEAVDPLAALRFLAADLGVEC